MIVFAASWKIWWSTLSSQVRRKKTISRYVDWTVRTSPPAGSVAEP